ncbi:SMP-30/gluconolactonase/LRE family protein [Nocardioides sp. J54]|uniref:SMP-30/gluconolactonase/LRE family protein n=1 Tax=Nocardioides sp. J54 TaxID=935866 RepID=UPI00048FA22E|nr:SMP-30/gluconolactonase/LRE family protein [Nocardioides sp. J54]
MTSQAVRRSTVLLLLAVLATAGLVPADAAGGRTPGTARVFAKVPAPGFPAYVHVHPNGRVYAGTYTNPTGDKMRSRVIEYSASGTLLRSWTVPGQDLAKPRGVQVAATDARGRLVLLEKSRARVLTLDVRTGRFTVQATIPDLPGGGHPIPNYATWGPGGALYLTDYGQDVVWRIPARGGKPRVWFRSARLAGIAGFGTTGIVYEPRTRSFLISQQTTGDALDLFRGHLYRLGVRADGRPGALTALWSAGGPLDLPDGFGVARSGNIYLALLGANRVLKLSPTGTVLARWSATGSAVPFDSPSNATFHGTRVLVANQSAVLGDASHHVILDLEVGERGAPVVVPKRSRLR